MQTRLPEKLLASAQGQRADEILRKCVHCGFCNATCPTYLLSGDELEGPRGRIYLIKEMLEEQQTSASTQQHLDSCLSCLNCQTTCPSGVDYAELIELGRTHCDQTSKRSLYDQFRRWLIRKIFTQPIILQPLFTLATWLKVYAQPVKVDSPSLSSISDKVIILDGCVQSVTAPNINNSLVKLLATQGIAVLRHKQTQCCGALDYHNGDQRRAKHIIKKNIDAWWLDIEQGVKTILMTSSGCGLTVKDYARIMAEDEDYAAKARVVSSITQDVSEYFTDFKLCKDESFSNVAFHSPCTLQHGQQINGTVETLLTRSGYNVIEFADSHLCCGSAGSYSLLHTEKANYFRAQKLANIEAQPIDVIATANIGCLMHLQQGTEVPVKHWLELVTMEKS